jgi:hypothetical protein
MLQDEIFRPIQFKTTKHCSLAERPVDIRETVVENMMKTSHRNIPATGGILKQ